MNYRDKYLKYKAKYINFKKAQLGGNNVADVNMVPSFDNGDGDTKVKRHLALLERFSAEGSQGPNWDMVKQLYDENIKFVAPDGTVIQGLDNQIKNMQQMYVAAPDVKVTSHNIQFGSGDWTAASQIMEGTFTGVLQKPDGTTIQGTGKKFKMAACSLLRWKNDKIIEEHVFWNDAEFNKQIGISCEHQM